jgi:hypothetical protein
VLARGDALAFVAEGAGDQFLEGVEAARPRTPDKLGIWE